MSDWRYFATRLNGDGTETLLASDMPLSGVTITDALSQPDSIDFDVEPEIPELKTANGSPLFLPWSTAVYAEKDGKIRHGSIVSNLSTSANGSSLKVTSRGFANYPQGMPWTNSTKKLYQVDPADMVRLIWSTLQTHPRGNLGVRLSTDVKTPVRVGAKAAALTDTMGQEVDAAKDEPLLFANYATTDLGKMVDELLEAGSIDYREEHSWRPDGTIDHFIRLAYPRMGVRRTDIAFNTEANCQVVPEVDIDADDYASECLLLCAGEGDKMVRSHAYNTQASRLRRVNVKLAKHIGRQATANTAAVARAKLMNTFNTDVQQIQVYDHPNAPLFSWNTGDEVRLTGFAGWGGTLDMWVRVLATSYNPDSNAAGATLTVVRADRV